MFKRILLVFVLMQMAVLFAHAQTLRITGKVLDDSTGVGLPNVSVVVAETKKGVSTDKDGNFTIAVTGRSSVTLNVSFVGYKATSVKTDGKTPVSITITKEQTQLDDVVVIGYQTVRRKDVLASVSSIGAKDLKDIPITSVAEALNGRLAGVTATTSEGSPDAAVRVRIRGGMSITSSNEPLYIIDGVQVESGLSSISPQDIQTIDVLKDAAATAIYGARGGNGVIIITTKSGKPGRTVVTLNSFVGFKKIARSLDVMDPYNFVVYQAERSRLQGGTDSTNFLKSYGTTWDTLNVYKNFAPVDWQREVYGQTGITQTHNIAASGGTKKLTYNLGYTFNNDKAIVLNSSFKRHLVNFKTDYKITKNLKVGVSSRYSNQAVNGAGVSADNGSSSISRLRNAVRYRPYLSTTQTIEEYVDPSVSGGIGNGLNLVNPIQLANAEYRRKSTDAFNITANVQYTITKNLSFKSTFGVDWNTRIDRQFFDTLTPTSKSNNTKPFVSLDTTKIKTFTNSNVLTYSIKGFKKNHNFDFLVGEETYDLRTESHNFQVRNYPYNIAAKDAFAQPELGAYLTGYPRAPFETRFTQLSFFGRIAYSYKDKYLLSANVREDGASKFAPGRRWGTFPAGSIAWRVKKEKFMENVNFLNDLKLRFGFGTMGNNRINDYLYLNTFANTGSRYYALNGQAVIAYVPTSLPNELLRWESTVNRNWGLDFTILKNRVDVSIDYYVNDSKDLLLNVNIDPTYGFTQQVQNVGKTQNKGFELQINSTILRNPRGLNWTANFNISHNNNKVVALGPGQSETLQGPAYGVAGTADYILRVGETLGTMWGLVNEGFYTTSDFNYDAATMLYTLKPGIVDNNAIIGFPVQPGSIKFKDLNGDGKIDLNNDRTIIGNPNPKLTGGLNQQFSYKNWDMSMFLNFMYDFDVYNANRIEFTNAYSPNSNMLSSMVDRWRIIDPSSGESLQWVSGGKVYGVSPDRLAAVNRGAKIWQPLISTGAFTPSSYAIEDGSFLRINNITLGYTLPVKSITRMHMSKLRFYFTANNVAIFTKYSGYDPEVSVRSDARTPNLDYSAYPKSRSYIFGINATF
jgi:TonB-linked SusC/RagA family outer membrane protein